MKLEDVGELRKDIDDLEIRVSVLEHVARKS